MPPESLQQILERRDEIKNELVEMLTKSQSDFVLEDILEVIYNEEGTDDLTGIIAMFDTGSGDVELSDILELVNDAWNYFPHKAVGGLSPAEMLLKHKAK